MPKGTQRSNRETKKPKKDKAPVAPGGARFIPAQGKTPPPGKK